jgi:hypothetical protein
MNRVIAILLVSVLGAGLVACATHGDLRFGADLAEPASHGFGCGVPLMTTALVTGVLSLRLTGSLATQPDLERRLRLPVPVFQPPERSA